MFSIMPNSIIGYSFTLNGMVSRTDDFKTSSKCSHCNFAFVTKMGYEIGTNIVYTIHTPVPYLASVPHNRSMNQYSDHYSPFVELALKNKTA